MFFDIRLKKGYNQFNISLNIGEYEMKKNLIYLDTYVLQRDMRIRLPKSILENLKVEKGVSRFKIYYDKINSQLVLKVEENDMKTIDKKEGR